LAAGRAHHLDIDFGKALVEGLDDLLLDLGEIRGVEHQLALGLRGGNQFGRTELLRSCRCTPCQRKTGDAGDCGNVGEDPSSH